MTSAFANIIDQALVTHEEFPLVLVWTFFVISIGDHGTVSFLIDEEVVARHDIVSLGSINSETVTYMEDSVH